MKNLSVVFKGLTILTICIGIILSSSNILAQGIGIGDADFTSNDHAILELKTSAKGFLPPRVNEASRLALAINSNLDETDIGLIVYQTDKMAGLYAWTGSNWTIMNATPIGAVKGFLTKQVPEKTGWAPMSASSTVDATKFPAFDALIGSSSNLGTKTGTSITLADWNGEGRFIRGSNTAGTPQVDDTKINGLKSLDAYVSEIGQHQNGKDLPPNVTIVDNKKNTLTGDAKQKVWVQSEDSNEFYTLTQSIYDKGEVEGGGTETRPLNYSVIWHVYVGLPVN